MSTSMTALLRAAARRLAGWCSPLVLLSLALASISGLLPAPRVLGPSVASAASPLPWQHKGFSLPVWGQDELLNSEPALQQLASTGANSVTFVVTWYQTDEFANEIFRTGSTASDASLMFAIGKARALGLQVNLKPQVDRQNGNWRAYINPTNPGQWFTSYGNMMGHYADLLQQNGGSVLVIGTELITLSTGATYTSSWLSLIANLRSRFSGKLTYGANWGSGDFAEEFTRIPFWEALDYIGINAYFGVSPGTETAQCDHPATPSVDQVKSCWNSWITTKIGPYQSQIGKPVMFTEVGYRSATGTAAEPWKSWCDPSGCWPLNTSEQVTCYEGFFESWANIPWFVGTAAWSWNVNTNVSPTDIWYEVQNKSALNTVTTWFGGSTQSGPPAITILNPQTNQTVAATITVKAVAQNAASVGYKVDAGTEAAMAYNGATGYYEAPLDTTTLANGGHNVTVVNHGTSGATAQDTAWTVQINNTAGPPPTAPSPTPSPSPSPTPTTSGPPAITIKNPLSNQSYSGTIQVQAQGSNLQGVSYSVQGAAAVPMTRDPNLNIWYVPLNTATFANGTYYVDVIGQGTSGGTVSDRAWSVTFTNSAAPSPTTVSTLPTVTPVSSPVPSATASTTALPAPSNLAASRGGPTSNQRIDLTWTSNAPGASIVVQRATDSTFASGQWSVELPAGTTSYRDSGLARSTTYYYRVLAKSGSLLSAPSNTASATTR